jgi:DNA-binding MarR family transcriptional regulator
MKKNIPAHQNGLHHKGDEPHLLREIVRTYQVLMMGFTREVGMPASRFAIMRILAGGLPNDMGIMQLARELGINAAAVTRQIKEMENSKLIIRRLDGKDKRRSHVKLSAKGLKVFKNIHNRNHELERNLSLDISADDMATTVDVLARLRRYLDGLR